MTNKIQIKRSTAATGPGTVLHAGELAYSYVSNKLFVGSSGGVGNPAHIIFGGNTGDINFVGITAGAGLTGTKITPTGDHTQTLAIDNTASIHMGGISCDGGFTLGGNLVFGGDYHIRNSANNTLIDFEGDRNFMVGDVDSAGNDTKIHMRDSHSQINMEAGTKIDLDSPIVYIPDKLTHNGDTDTFLNFSAENTVDVEAGGWKFLAGASASGVGTINLGGATFGTDGGATYGGNIVLQNNDYISNPSDYTVRIMPEGTNATDYGLEFEFSDWGYGSVITNRRASDGANAGSIKFDSAVVINSDTDLTFGSNAHTRMRWTTTGNNTFQIGVKATDTNDDCSGAVAIINSTHFGQAYRSPGVTHDNPNLYVYSISTDANDYIRFEHDGTNANIVTGAGDISLQPASGVLGVSGSIDVSGGATFANKLGLTGSSFIMFPDGTTQSQGAITKYSAAGSNVVDVNSAGNYSNILDISSNDFTCTVSAGTMTVGAEHAVQYTLSAGSNMAELDGSSQTWTGALGNVFTTPIGSPFYAAGTATEVLKSILDSSATHMGVTAGEISFKVSGTDILKLDTDIHAKVGISADAGATFGGAVTATSFAGALTGNVTGNASGSAATVTTAAQGNITSVGTLTALTMGGELSCVDNLVTRPELKDIAETVNAIGTITGDTAVSFAAGNVQTVTGNGDCLFTFTNPPASGKSGTLTLIITNGGANTTTWHSSVKWPGDNAPALTSSGVDVVSLMTIDAGTTIYGFVGGINFS